MCCGRQAAVDLPSEAQFHARAELFRDIVVGPSKRRSFVIPKNENIETWQFLTLGNVVMLPALLLHHSHSYWCGLELTYFDYRRAFVGAG